MVAEGGSGLLGSRGVSIGGGCKEQGLAEQEVGEREGGRRGMCSGLDEGKRSGGNPLSLQEGEGGKINPRGEVDNLGGYEGTGEGERRHRGLTAHKTKRI